MKFKPKQKRAFYLILAFIGLVSVFGLALVTQQKGTVFDIRNKAADTTIQTLTASCPSPGTTATFSWPAMTTPGKYYIRINNLKNGWTYPTNQPGDGYDNNVTTNSYTFASEPGATYEWWIHDVPDNGSQSGQIHGPNFTCGTPIAAPTRTEQCKIETINPGTITPSTPVTITSESLSNTTKKFTYGFYNLDNLYSANNPKGISFTQGTGFIIERSFATPIQKNSITVNFADIDKPDLNWNNQKPKNIQVSAYFTDSNNNFSLPNTNCVVKFNVSIPPVPPTPTSTPKPKITSIPKKPTPTNQPQQNPTSTPEATTTPEASVSPTPSIEGTVTPTDVTNISPEAYLRSGISLTLKPGTIFYLPEKPNLPGKTFPKQKVQLTLYIEESDSITKIIDSDSEGNFSFTPDTTLPVGEYKYWALLIHDDGSKGDLEGPVTFYVKEKKSSSIIKILLIIIIALGLIGGLVFYFWKRRKKEDIDPSQIQ